MGRLAPGPCSLVVYVGKCDRCGMVKWLVEYDLVKEPSYKRGSGFSDIRPMFFARHWKTDGIL